MAIGDAADQEPEAQALGLGRRRTRAYVYPSSIGSSAGHIMSIWNQWSMTESVRTPMASAACASRGERRTDGARHRRAR